MSEQKTIKWKSVGDILSSKTHEVVPVEDSNGKVVNTYVLVDKPPREYISAHAFDIDTILATGNEQLLKVNFHVPHDLNSIDDVIRASHNVARSIDEFNADLEVKRRIDDQKSSSESTVVTDSSSAIAEGA